MNNMVSQQFMIWRLFLTLYTIVGLAAFGKLNSSQDPVEDHLRNVDHVKLSKSRLIVDDAISEGQLRSLLSYINQDPILSKGEAFHVSDGALAHKFALRNLYEIYLSVNGELRRSHNGKIDEAERQEKILNYSTTQKYLHMMRDILSIQMQILDYAESFFQRKFGIKGGTLFLRKKVSIERLPEHSPVEVNNASGWLFPPHVDGCKFHEETWSCEDIFTDTELLDFSKRNISAVLYLNELPEEAGGDFCFIDAPGRKVKSIVGQASQPHSRALSRNLDPYSVHDYTMTSSNIPPPSPAQIKKAAAQQRRMLNDQPNKISKVIPVYESGINYSVITPKLRRLLIFNSSADNIHAVTQLLDPRDRRYTLFMFLSDKAEDNS